jgi:hypothetical protein
VDADLGGEGVEHLAQHLRAEGVFAADLVRFFRLGLAVGAHVGSADGSEGFLTLGTDWFSTVFAFHCFLSFLFFRWFWGLFPEFWGKYICNLFEYLSIAYFKDFVNSFVMAQ